MNLTPEMILRGYQANTAALEEMIFVKGKVAVVTGDLAAKISPDHNKPSFQSVLLIPFWTWPCCACHG